MNNMGENVSLSLHEKLGLTILPSYFPFLAAFYDERHNLVTYILSQTLSTGVLISVSSLPSYFLPLSLFPLSSLPPNLFPSFFPSFFPPSLFPPPLFPSLCPSLLTHTRTYLKDPIPSESNRDTEYIINLNMVRIPRGKDGL